MSARDLALDSNYDLAIVGQDLAPLVADTASIVSDVEATLLFMLGEWFLDLSQGLPWFQEVLGPKKVNLQAMKAAITSAIAARQGITQVQFVTLTQNTTRRSLSVTWAAFSDATLLGSTLQVSP